MKICRSFIQLSFNFVRYSARAFPVHLATCGMLRRWKNWHKRSCPYGIVRSVWYNNVPTGARRWWDMELWWSVVLPDAQTRIASSVWTWEKLPKYIRGLPTLLTRCAKPFNQERRRFGWSRCCVSICPQSNYDCLFHCAANKKQTYAA